MEAWILLFCSCDYEKTAAQPTKDQPTPKPTINDDLNVGDAIRQAIQAAEAEGEDLIAAELQIILTRDPAEHGGPRGN